MKFISTLQRALLSLEGAVLAALAIADAISIVLPIVRPVALVLWICAFCLLFRQAIVLPAGCRPLSRYPLTAVSLLIIAAGVTWLALDPSNVSHESTQQMGCALEKLSQWPFTGSHEDCFLGYPARQYFIPALPSLVLGRTQFALNFGQLLYLMLGLLLFARAWPACFKSSWMADGVGATFLLSSFQSYFFRYQLLNFEQSLSPISLAFAVTGLALLFLRTPSPRLLSLFALALYYATFSYTPSLALVFLGCGLLGLAALYNFARMRVAYVLHLIAVIVAVLVSFTFRIDVILTPRAGGMNSIQEKLVSLWATFVDPWRELALLNIPLKLMLACFIVWLLVVSVGALVALVRGRKVPHSHLAVCAWLIVVWMLATTMASVLAPGYANPPVEFAVHRALVCWPVFLGMFGLALAQLEWARKFLVPTLFVIAVFFVQDGAKKLIQFQKEKFDNRHFLLLDWMASYSTGSRGGWNVVIFSPAARDWFLSLADEATYFMPELKYTFWNEKCEVEKPELLQGKVLAVEWAYRFSGCLKSMPNTFEGMLAVPEATLSLYTLGRPGRD